MSTATERRVTGSEWWDYHLARSAAALQWYTDPHSQVLFTVFVIALVLPRRLVISLTTSTSSVKCERGCKESLSH